MSFEPLVSIVVPIYNMGASVKKCVNSIAAQTYSNLEIILVDDGSKDDSLDICNELKNEDRRIKVFHTENSGSGPARNYGIDQARGGFICFLDADDILTPDAIQKMVMASDGGKHDLVIAGFALIDQNGKTERIQRYSNEAHSGEEIRRFYPEFVGSQSACPINGAPWIKLFDLKIIRQYQIEYPPLRRHQDTAFIMRYLSHTNSVFFLDEVLYFHYLNDITLVWEKYPKDYFDICYELNQIMTQTVLSWSPENEETKALVRRGYITRAVKSIELTYSKKLNLNRREQLSWLIEADEKYELGKEEMPSGLDAYHKAVFVLIKRKQYHLVLLLCGVKVLIERKGFLKRIKTLLREEPA